MQAHPYRPLEFTEYTEEELIRQIRTLLTEMGMSTHLKGFSYLCRAIEIVYMDKIAIRNVIVGLYRQIAEENRTTVSCVERNCRTAIKLLFKNGDKLKLSEHFLKSSAEDTPSVREFTALLADKLRRNLINTGRTNL